MNGIAESATEFWNFFWPAFFRLIFTLYVIFSLCPHLGHNLQRTLNGLPVRRFLRIITSKTAEALGFPKLIPIFTLFSLVLVLVVFTDMAKATGSFLGPSLVTYSPSDIVNLGVSDYLVDVWATLSPGSELAQLSQYIENRSHSIRDGQYISHYQEKKGRIHSFWTYLWFFVFLILLLLVLSVKYPGEIRRRRACTYLLLLVIAIVISATAYFRVHRSMVRAKVYTVWADSTAQTADRTDEIDKVRNGTIEERKETDPIWWGVRW